MERIKIRSLLKQFKIGQKSLSARNTADSTSIWTSHRARNLEMSLKTDREHESLYHSSILNDSSQLEINEKTINETILNEDRKNSFSIQKSKIKKHVRTLNKTIINPNQLKVKDLTDNLQELGISRKTIIERNIRNIHKNVTIHIQRSIYLQNQKRKKEKRASVGKILYPPQTFASDSVKLAFVKKINSKNNIKSLHLANEDELKSRIFKKLMFGKEGEIVGQIKRKNSEVGPWDIELPAIINYNL